MTMHMNAQPFAQLAAKLGLPPNASREDVAGAFLDLRAEQQEKIGKLIKKGINGKNTLLAAFESRAVREPEALARVLDTLPGVTDFQSVALAMIGAVEGMRSYRKQIAAAGNFDAKAETLVDLDRAIAMLSREGLLTTPTTSSASSSSASTSTAPKTTVDEYRGLGRELYAQAVAQGVDIDRLVAVRAAMSGERVPEAALRPSKLPKASAPPSNLSADTVEKARRAGVDPNRVADTLRAILRRGEQS